MYNKGVFRLRASFVLPTRTKLFCHCATDAAPKNARCCPKCLRLPGALPALNGEAVTLAISAARALGCSELEPRIVFLHNGEKSTRARVFSGDKPINALGIVVSLHGIYLEGAAPESDDNYNRAGKPTLAIDLTLPTPENADAIVCDILSRISNVMALHDVTIEKNVHDNCIDMYIDPDLPQIAITPF